MTAKSRRYVYQEERKNILREPWLPQTLTVHAAVIDELSIAQSVTVAKMQIVTGAPVFQVAATLDYLCEVGLLAKLHGGEDVKLLEWCYTKNKEAA